MRRRSTKDRSRRSSTSSAACPASVRSRRNASRSILLKVDAPDAKRLARAIEDAKDRVAWCRRCFNISEGELCAFCRDERRDTHVVCVVEEPRDIVAVERTGEFRGRYHVLQGAISPIEGIGPEQLRVKELLARIPDEEITEVILATNPNIEGEATAMYLARLLKPAGPARHAHRERPARRRRPRIRRRGHARPRARRPARSRRLSVSAAATGGTSG